MPCDEAYFKTGAQPATDGMLGFELKLTNEKMDDDSALGQVSLMW